MWYSCRGHTCPVLAMVCVDMDLETRFSTQNREIMLLYGVFTHHGHSRRRRSHGVDIQYQYQTIYHPVTYTFDTFVTPLLDQAPYDMSRSKSPT